MMVSAILLAAGASKRLGAKVSKPLVKICSKPAIIYSLLTLSRQDRIDEIIVVVNKNNKFQIIKSIKQFGIKKIKAIVEGGLRRQDSVRSGLARISDKSSLVLIHDSARPFITRDLIAGVIKKAEKTGAAILGVPVKATIKSAGSHLAVDKTLDRRKLWEIQTPQVFARDLICEAYKKFGDSLVTHDASLVEKTKARVSIVMGSYANIKITTVEDLDLAESIARKHKL